MFEEHLKLELRFKGSITKICGRLLKIFLNLEIFIKVPLWERNNGWRTQGIKATFLIPQGDCKVVRTRVCNGQTHKVRSDGTRITCQDGKFKAVKGRKGKSQEENDLESKTTNF